MPEWEIDLTNLNEMAPQVQAIIERSHFQVAVTGAGISLASGLPLISDEIQGIPLRTFFGQALLKQSPRKFYDAYREILKTWRSAIPNEAHHALAKHGVWVITQNIDGLHRDAGSQRLIELHGNLRELRCRNCEVIFGAHLAWQADVPRCPGCGEMLFPGFTLVGDSIRHWSRAVDWVGRADVLFIVGTTLNMMPIQGLPTVIQRQNGAVFRVNERAEHILPRLFDKQKGPSHK